MVNNGILVFKMMIDDEERRSGGTQAHPTHTLKLKHNGICRMKARTHPEFSQSCNQFKNENKQKKTIMLCQSGHASFWFRNWISPHL